jgi:hypothetical protein
MISACCPPCSRMTASSSPPTRHETRPSPTPITWPSCMRSGPPRPPARNQHYRDLHINALPPGHRAEPGHQALWLWRTLRAAELAGLDPARVLAEAIAERDLAGSRDVPAVIDARILYRLGSVVPLPPGSWSAQVPAIADPDRRTGPSRCRPVDKRPGRRAPEVRRPAGRPAEPDDPGRRPRLRRPRPGLPRLDRILPRCDPAAAETTDPSLGPRPRARRGPRGRHRSRGMTVARCILDVKGRPRLLRG